MAIITVAAFGGDGKNLADYLDNHNFVGLHAIMSCDKSDDQWDKRLFKVPLRDRFHEGHGMVKVRIDFLLVTMRAGTDKVRVLVDQYKHEANLIRHFNGRVEWVFLSDPDDLFKFAPKS